MLSLVCSKVGQSVYACGFPYGLPASLASGVVSGLNRSIPSPVGTRIYGTIQVGVCMCVFVCCGGTTCQPLRFTWNADKKVIALWCTFA